MIGKKIQVAMASAKHIVDIIHPRHTISLVAFQSYSELLIDNARATPEEKDRIKHQIERTRSVVGGATNLGDGIRRGLRALEDAQQDAKVMIILSDGAATWPKEAAKAAQEASEAGVQLFAVGIGDQYDAAQLLRLVRQSNGTVLGDSDLDRIQGAFAHLIGRIDTFVATHARLALSFAGGVRPGMAYKTSPEKAAIGPLTMDEDGRVLLQVGNIERHKTYGFLLQLIVPELEPGESEIARATLIYDVPSQGLHDAQTDLRITVHCTGDQRRATAQDPRVLDALQSASVAQLIEDLVDTYDRNDRQLTTKHLQNLIHRCGQMGDNEMKGRLENLLEELGNKGRISRAHLNACLVASTAKDSDDLSDASIAEDTDDLPDASSVVRTPSDQTTVIRTRRPRIPPDQSTAIRTPMDQSTVIRTPPDQTTVIRTRRTTPSTKIRTRPDPSTKVRAPRDQTTQIRVGDYDVILIDVGETPIRVVREIRDATGLRLRTISEMVKKENATICRSMSRDDADALRDRIVGVGARAEVRHKSGSKSAAA
jgi:ribosomal protein L7/L12